MVWSPYKINIIWLNYGLTMNDNTDVTSRLIHTSPFVPSVRYRVVTSNGVEMITAVKTANHIDQVIQGT